MKTETCKDQVIDDVVQHGCGAPIVLALVVPEHPRKGVGRKRIPLNPTYDPACGIPPSHAITSRTLLICRPLDRGDTPAPHEDPALTHLATCPHRRRP